MDASDARLRGIPRSRDTIASLDPQHDPRSKRTQSSQTRPNRARSTNQCVARVAQNTSRGITDLRWSRSSSGYNARSPSKNERVDVASLLVVIIQNKADVSLVIGINVKDHLHELAAAMHHPKAQNLERAAVLLVNPHNVRHWCDPAR